MTRGPKKFANEEALEFGERVFGLFDPSPELLQQTINAVFWASMSKEEGKPVLPRVMFNDIRGPYCRIEPHHVSPESIRKLSPFLDVASNGLHINRNAKIVGVGPWRNRDIGIVARRPGQIAVLDGTLVLGVLENGNWIVVGGSSLNVGLILQRAFSENAFTERFRKATVIVQVAMQARLTQRGATFVMLPGGKGAGIGRPNYSIESFAALPQSLEDWRRADVSTPDMLVRTQIVELSRNAIAITGAGAGIDGATIIDESDLHLTGFGAKISAEDDDLDVRLVALPVAEIQSKKKKDLGGMRHQMAARLVQMNHEAMVITVSQDGPVSLFAWVHQEGCVVVMKHLDRYFEAEAELGR